MNKPIIPGVRIHARIPEVQHEALKVLSALNKAKGKDGGDVSKLLGKLAAQYARKPENLTALRAAGFKQVEELISK